MTKRYSHTANQREHLIDPLERTLKKVQKAKALLQDVDMFLFIPGQVRRPYK